ncbi:MAG: GntR family transcriptional regulator [Vicinamibacterales bacterium]
MVDDRKKATPIRRRVLREEIREHVIDDILSGRLAPGTRIVETRLARQFGVSQAPVREALRDLALFGFVVCSPFRSTFVRQISTADLLQSYPVRAALESVAAREAAAVIDEATLAQLEDHIASMRRAAEANDHRAHVDADYAFHHTIIKAAGNDMLEHVWLSMRLATTTLVTHSMIQMTHRSMSEIGERHVAVLDALRSRDPLRAENAMRRHIEEPGEWIREAVRKEQEQAKAATPAEPPKRATAG